MLSAFPLCAAQREDPPAAGADRARMLLVAPNSRISEADARYRRRHEGHNGARAAVGPISRAISGYEAAAGERSNAEARWKLVRALYFRATYTGLPDAERRSVLEKGKRVGEEALAILAERAEGRGARGVNKMSPVEKARAMHDDTDAGPSYFWTTVAWGEWALAVGKLKAARTGAASRIRDYAQTVIALDPDLEEGGGYRILGRLHDQAPRLPLLTGWVSRAEGLRNLRLAARAYPRNFVNRHFLAEALAAGGPSDRAEAVQIEQKLVAESPSSEHPVEEMKIQQDAQRNLSAWTR